MNRDRRHPAGKHWWSGWERTDPEGYPVRIAALWTRCCLWPGYAMVAKQTVWIRSPLTYRRYLRSKWWRAHEHHHFEQEREYFRGRTWLYLLAFAWQYIRYGGHANAPLEQEANRAADEAASLSSDKQKRT